MIEKMAPLGAYQGDVRALQKLQQLHLVCNILPDAHCCMVHTLLFISQVAASFFNHSDLQQRETHLRALQLTLLQEGRGVPNVEAATTSETYVVLDMLSHPYP
jgi:hypothetical protein